MEFGLAMITANMAFVPARTWRSFAAMVPGRGGGPRSTPEVFLPPADTRSRRHAGTP
jgi:hypothetical protein